MNFIRPIIILVVNILQVILVTDGYYNAYVGVGDMAYNCNNILSMHLAKFKLDPGLHRLVEGFDFCQVPSCWPLLLCLGALWSLQDGIDYVWTIMQTF